MTRRRWALAVTGALVAPTLQAAPLPVPTEALLRDVERVVLAQETLGWFLDEPALDAIQSTMLESVCRTPAPHRRRAVAVLRSQRRAAGDPRAVFRREGSMTSAASHARHVDRKYRALRRAVASAPERCPYWVTPRDGYIGRQTDWRRWTLQLETGGVAQLRQTRGELTLGGAGTGRLQVGRALGDTTLLLGPELSAGGMLRLNDPSSFVVNYFVSVPLALRLNRVNWHVTGEVGPVTWFEADDTRLSWGIHGGATVGVYALRVRGIIPWAGPHLAYDHYFQSGGRPPTGIVRFGVRVGFVWDPVSR